MEFSENWLNRGISERPYVYDPVLCPICLQEGNLEPTRWENGMATLNIGVGVGKEAHMKQ
jgi:hypothetical protein